MRNLGSTAPFAKSIEKRAKDEPAGISFMITQQEKAKLRELGYSDEEISTYEAGRSAPRAWADQLRAASKAPFVNHRQPRTAFESDTGRSALSAGTRLHAPLRSLTKHQSRGLAGW